MAYYISSGSVERGTGRNRHWYCDTDADRTSIPTSSYDSGDTVFVSSTNRIWFADATKAWIEASRMSANHELGGFYMEFDSITAPTNPTAGKRRVFVDSADGKLKVRTSGGSSVSLEEQGAAGSAKETHIDLISLFSEATF